MAMILILAKLSYFVFTFILFILLLTQLFNILNSKFYFLQKFNLVIGIVAKNIKNKKQIYKYDKRNNNKKKAN